MPKDPQNLPSGVRPTDTLTVTQFATVFPIDSVVETLDSHGRGTIRVRTLPNEHVIFFVMMLALYRDCSHTEVYRCVAQALQNLAGNARTEPVIPTASALSQARDRVGAEPFADLFKKHAIPLAGPGAKGCFFKNRYRKVALDGCLIDTDDTDKNRKYFGHSSNQSDTAARSPQVRVVGLMELGTHAFFKAAIGTYHQGESTLAKSLVDYLEPDMICLADRKFYSFELFRMFQERNVPLLFRLQRGMSFQPEEQLSDGSFIVKIHARSDTSKRDPLVARLIQYKVTGSKNKEIFYLITNILDPKIATAVELAALYCERWEYENALDELKTHLNAGAVILRSKTPDLVIQELWGLLMTHYVIRRTMFLASSRKNLDPDRISFTHSVNVIRRALVKTGIFPPEAPEDAE